MLILLWLHFFWCLIPSWQDGVYYAYGWLVAPLAMGFAWRRWQLLQTSRKDAAADGERRIRVPWILLGMYLLALIPTRIVELADPGWRIPIWGQALLLLALTVRWLGLSLGWRAVWWFAPVIVFALTAVPLPWQIEQLLVRQLTGAVTEVTQELFLIQAVPVERAGERLLFDGEAVEVGDACSGIRSLQTMIMAALFFGELLWLSWSRRLVLIGLAGFCALATNVGRAYWLARVQFADGPDAVAAVHDMAGHLAFGLSALILFVAARLMLEPLKRRVVVRQTRAEPG